MITQRFSHLFAALASIGLLLATSLEAPAQTSRPASTTNTSRSTTPSNTSRPSGGSSGSGARQYSSNTMLGDALIQIDPETRSVVVVTDEETQASIAKVINNLDHPKPQVLIKVAFIEVTLDKDLDVGLEGSYTVKTDNNGTVTAKTFYGMANALANGGYGAFGTLTSDNWMATLHMLSSSGKAKVLSRPSIMARNNQQAVIVVGQQVPLVTSSQVNADGVINNSIRYQDVGIILRVTPFITSDKTVEMIVAPEISSLSDQTVPIGSFNAPIINKRSAETVVVTPNATTVVIGGLMQKQVSSTVKKVPLLGDIPILGLPFRHTVKNDTKSELLIFLTPYIVESTQKVKDVTIHEANQAELTRDALTPEEVSNNLDTLRLIPQFDSNGLPQDKTEIVEAPAPIPTPTPAPAKTAPKK